MKSLKQLLFNLPLLLIVISFIGCESVLVRDYNHHMSGRDLGAAKNLINDELDRNPNNAEAHYLMGNLLSREKNYDQAEVHFDASLDESSVYSEHIEFLRENNYRKELNAGIEAWEEDEIQTTIRHVEFAREIFPERVELYPILGSAYVENRQPEEAQKHLRSCLSYDESNFECALSLANSLYNTEQYNAAIEFINDFSSLTLDTEEVNDSKFSAFIKTLSYSHFEIGEMDKAEEYFIEYLKFPVEYDELKQFAIEMYNIKELYRAEKYLRECLASSPRDKEVLEALSSIYLETSHYELMVQANERLHLLEPDNQEIKKRLMLSYELYGDLDKYEAIKSELGLDEQ